MTFPKVSRSERTRAENRDLLAAVIRSEPGARAAYKHLLRLGARNIRPDYQLSRTATGEYVRSIDGCAWNATALSAGIHVCMIRHGENDWSIHS